ncbi:hypothetical protein [Streptomyces sp. PU_AKi4]|uniref:hypothetical protein n=1 Tax=Streptomyces sp. PU_AKi4 TaxID=2800809 RepID=UPI0035233273
MPTPSAPSVRVDLVHDGVLAVRVGSPGGTSIFFGTDRFHASCTISSTAAAPISVGVVKSRLSEAALPSKPHTRSAYAVTEWSLLL